MSFETFLAVWGRLTPGAVLAMVLYATFAAALAVLVRWLRPKWSSATTVAAVSLPIPLALIVLGIMVYLGTTADTRPWPQSDKAEGFAAAYWFGVILAPPALLLGVVGASCAMAAARLLKRAR